MGGFLSNKLPRREEVLEHGIFVNILMQSQSQCQSYGKKFLQSFYFLSHVVICLVGLFFYPILVWGAVDGSVDGGEEGNGVPTATITTASSASSIYTTEFLAGPVIEELTQDPVTIGFPDIMVKIDDGADPFASERSGNADFISELNALLPAIISFYPRITPVFDSDLKSRLRAVPLFGERMDLARHHLDEGVRLYKMMRLDEAVNQLKKSGELLDILHGQWMAAEQLREVHLYTALASLEAGQRSSAHLAFKRMLALQPDYRLQEGYFSAAARSSFELALNDFQVTYLDRVEPHKAVGLAAGADVDFLLFASVKRRAEAGLALELALFDRKAARYLAEEVVPLLHSTARLERHDVELLDRAFSRMIACIPDRDQFMDGRGKKKVPRQLWSLGVGGNFLMFLEGFTRNPLPNYGVTVSMTRRLPETNLALWSAASILTSGKDRPREDIRDAMYLGRLLVGGGLVVEPEKWLELSLIPALELALPSKATYTWEAQCKYDPSSSPDCAGKIQSHRPGLIMGGHIRAGVGVKLKKSTWLHLNCGIGRYFISMNENKLDVPLDLSLSAGYRY